MDATLNEVKDKIFVTYIAFIYEYICVKHIGDQSKQGYVITKYNNGTLFDSIGEIIAELEVISEMETLGIQQKRILDKILTIYKNNGFCKELEVYLYQIILSTPDIYNTLPSVVTTLISDVHQEKNSK